MGVTKIGSIVVSTRAHGKSENKHQADGFLTPTRVILKTSFPIGLFIASANKLSVMCVCPGLSRRMRDEFSLIYDRG